MNASRSRGDGTPSGRTAAPRRNPSRTRAPLVEADVDLWPAWTKLPVEHLNYELFDARGYRLASSPERRQA